MKVYIRTLDRHFIVGSFKMYNSSYIKNTLTELEYFHLKQLFKTMDEDKVNEFLDRLYIKFDKEKGKEAIFFVICLDKKGLSKNQKYINYKTFFKDNVNSYMVTKTGLKGFLKKYNMKSGKVNLNNIQSYKNIFKKNIDFVDLIFKTRLYHWKLCRFWGGNGLTEYIGMYYHLKENKK